MICVHPYDRTTEFLEEILNKLENIEQLNAKIFRLELTEKSHEDCLLYITQAPGKKTILFFGHGGTNYIMGASGDFVDAFGIDEGAIEDDKHKYRHGHFINRSNISVFNEKRVFCLSCNSSVDLGKLAVENGAEVFLGFEDIPTDIGEFAKLELKVNQSNVDLFNKELVSIIVSSLLLGIERKSSFNELSSLIRLFSNVKIKDLVSKEPQSNMKRQLADALYHFKKGIKVFGNGELKFAE